MQDITGNIIIRASEGDIVAFEMIYREYIDFVSNVAYRVVNSREDAEEVTQEVFLNIYRQLKHFRFESSLKTWIYRITVNTAINYSKKTSKHQNEVAGYIEVSDRVNTSEGAPDAISEEISEEIITALLDAITPDQRACIVLRSIEGLSYQEIAETLKIPVNTVRSRIKRARETMLSKRKEVIQNEL
ncbi:MAG TPA: sigma-70 family RNA polymerase sigma factor [Nitrospirota bacterium]|nr:sigma-70 family RNA polymerase sigma factor [Nitrospirota bacterium]